MRDKKNTLQLKIKKGGEKNVCVWQQKTKKKAQNQ